MEITGKIVEILPAQTGQSARGEWRRQDIIIETQEQYPKKVCLENWNNKVDLNTFSVGSTITASINVESREFNGKWYTSARVWKAVAAGQQQGQSVAQQPNTPPPPADIPPPSEDLGGGDDLPF